MPRLVGARRAEKTFYLCSRTVRFVKAPGRPQKITRGAMDEDRQRKIIHVDNGRLLMHPSSSATIPDLRGKPVAVGGSREARRRRCRKL